MGLFYIFFYRIKNFFYLFKKSFFKGIFFNLKFKRNKNSIISFKKNFEEELSIQCIDFDEKLLQKNLKPFMGQSLSFQMIKKRKVEIFNNLLTIINNLFPFRIKIGLEIEFYTKEINQTLFKNLNINNIINEMGIGQKEIQTNPYIDMNLLVDEYEKIKTILKDANFDAAPFDDDCGSALQINLSIDDGKNLFARNDDGKDSNLLFNCVAGLLNNINNNLLLYISDASCLARYDVERNKNIKNKGKYPAPTFISWGINNRTSAVRIPTPKNFNDYFTEDKENRRIEFRVPSAKADIYLVLIGVLTSVIDGIRNNLYPIEKTSYDVLEKNESLEKIKCDFDELQDIFYINEDVLFF
ncbi:MAG: hypothetical protein LBC92_01160 [Rickettsiales bacterium]|jgi:glutamine synthetase|nr:hypothetical protein [Rickettsiales bacterium]